MLRRMQQQLQQGSLWTSSTHSQPQTSSRRAWWPSTGSKDDIALPMSLWLHGPLDGQHSQLSAPGTRCMNAKPSSKSCEQLMCIMACMLYN